MAVSELDRYGIEDSSAARLVIAAADGAYNLGARISDLIGKRIDVHGPEALGHVMGVSYLVGRGIGKKCFDDLTKWREQNGNGDELDQKATKVFLGYVSLSDRVLETVSKTVHKLRK